MLRTLLLAAALVLTANLAMAGYDYSTKRLVDETPETVSSLDSNCLIPVMDTDADDDGLEDNGADDTDSSGDADFITCTDIPGVGSGETPSEIERATDPSARTVDLDDLAETITAATHGSRIMYLSTSVAQTITLPDGGAATGEYYVFAIGPNFSSATATIQVPSGDNSSFAGAIMAWDEVGALTYVSAATFGGSDTIKLSSANTDRGDFLVITSTNTSEFLLDGQIRFESIGQDTVLYASSVTSTD